MKKQLKIAYIGGGSRQWARHLMSDLALEDTLYGTVALYDIDYAAAKQNAQLGALTMADEQAVGQWSFVAEEQLDDALRAADVVFISIVPGTLEDMVHYVHEPEKWGVYQSVGDTVGPAGLFRSLIMMPIYQVFSQAIARVCPKAWVINFTNPMTMCLQTLYHVFPDIKAFGNCHEIFYVQRILARALKEETGIDTQYHTIEINPKGLNHFTWIDYASYQDIDLMPIYQRFVKRYQATGMLGDDWKNVGPFGSAERVKFDLFDKTGMIAAAGDRHLVEFLPQAWYLKDQETIKNWRFYLTPVALRQKLFAEGTQRATTLIANQQPLNLVSSGEDGIAQVRALFGLETLTTNINMPNQGQIPSLPLGHIVETNAHFRYNDVRPVMSGEMSGLPLEYTLKQIQIHQLLLEAFDQKDLRIARKAFHLDPLTDALTPDDKNALFDQLVRKLAHALTYYASS